MASSASSRAASYRLTFVALLFAACEHSDSTAPGDAPGQLETPPPALASTDGVLEPVTVTAGISDIHNPRDSVALPHYHEATLIRFSVTGLTRMYWNWPAESVGILDMTFDARGRPAGSQCFVQFVAWYQVGGNLIWGNCIGAQSQDTLRLTRLVSGDGKAKWSGRYPQNSNDCNQGPCWYYEGDKVLTIEPVQAELTLTASAPAVTPGTQVTFTARVTPDTVDGKPVPFRVTRWKFMKDTGDSTTPCYLPPANTNPAYCTFTPPTSGQLVVEAKVNTVPLVERRYVSVLSCLTGDSLLDNGSVRRGLLDELAASGTGQNRLERAGYIYRRNDGSYFMRYATASATDCRSQLSPPENIPDAVPVTIWHTHPGRRREPLYSCQSSRPGDWEDPFRNGGGSDLDWANADTAGVPLYTITHGMIARLDPGTSPGNRWRNPNRWNYTDGPNGICLTRRN